MHVCVDSYVEIRNTKEKSKKTSEEQERKRAKLTQKSGLMVSAILILRDCYCQQCLQVPIELAGQSHDWSSSQTHGLEAAF
jgi:hypothetical protein